MRGRQEGQRTALIVTRRPELGAELTEAIDQLGLDSYVVSTLDHLESHADARPALVIADLALDPSEEQWASLGQLFPRSVIWAVSESSETSGRDVTAAFKHGCHDCLPYPVSHEELARKLGAILAPPGTRTGELDRFMSNEIKLELPSDVSIIEHVVKLLVGYVRDYRSFGPRQLVNLRVALSEALSNAIIYGNESDRTKKVRLRASVDAWTIKVQITDEGPGFDHSEKRDPTHDDAIEQSSGRGLFLLRQLADDVSFNEIGNSLTLTLRSEWSEAPPIEPVRAVAADAEALAAQVERLRASLDIDLHLWAETIDGELRHLAPTDGQVSGPDGTLHWLHTPGMRYAVQVWPGGDEASERWAEFARSLLDETLSYRLRLAEGRRDLAERQEEIELLHGITETLGAVIRLEEAAVQILEGVIRVTGADRASLWIYDPEAEELVLAASVGPSRIPVERVPVSSPVSVSALAFRENRTIRLDEARDLPSGLAERFKSQPEPWVAVPVSYSQPGGGRRAVGVLNLIGRRSGAVVSDASETRLLQTLARQIGSAVENLRLFEEILAREKLIGELALAQDLQMKLLPDLSEFHEIADVAARCVPARPVGGDFYQLFRLSDGKIGAMLGDVTSHGFGASLIMALSMSVMAVYARETVSPGDLLRAIHRALIQKLESTEMFMTVFYGVIDPAEQTLVYANAGHAHAFRFHGDEPAQRLMATSPPLGIAQYGSYGESRVAWQPGDLLCLFTDGLTNPSLKTTEAAVVEAVDRLRRRQASEIIAAMFEARGRRGGEAPDDQTAFVLRA